jgi:plastocyanin
VVRRFPHLARIALAITIGWYGESKGVAADTPAVVSDVERGAIEGTITYRADAARPWRYARYYIKNAKAGELSEAVVAIRGKLLDHKQPASATTVTMDQQDFQFAPEVVTIRVGDSVKFTNSDQATHNVRAAGDLANINVTMPAGGAGNTIKFDRAGGVRRPVEIGCVFHSNMRAWIFVFDHPFYAVTKANGKFKLADVPAGEYELEMAHPAGGLRWKKPVTVKAGETAKVDVQVSPADVK